MQIAITSRHGHISTADHDYISEKSERLTHYFDRISQIQVTVDLANEQHIDVEIQVNAEHKHDFVSSATGGEVALAFDQAFSKMETQIRKYKEKVQDHRRDRPMNEITNPDQY